MQLVESALKGSGPAIFDRRSGITVRRLDVAAAVAAIRGGSPTPTPGTGDRMPPTMSAITETLEGQVTNTTVPVTLSWSANDASGIAGYEVYSIVPGGQWTRENGVPAGTTSHRFALTAGSRYAFAVRAKDRAGNVSRFSMTNWLTTSITDDSAFQIQGSSWGRYPWADAVGGTGLTSSQPGTWIQHTFTGRAVGLVAPMFSGAGRASVYCDGAYKGISDLHAASMSPRLVAYWCKFSQSGQHTMKVQVEGTAGRPRFDVDAFVSLS